MSIFIAIVYYLVDFAYVYKSSKCFRTTVGLDNIKLCRQKISNIYSYTTDAVVACIIFISIVSILVINWKIRSLDSSV